MQGDRGTTSIHPLASEDARVLAARRALAAEDSGQEDGPRDRAQFDAIIETMLEAPRVRSEPGRVGGVPGWWCRPAGARPGATLLFAHGGGYVLGSAFPFRKMAGQLALRVRADAFIPEYRLAPENPFPAAIDDVWAVYRGLVRDGAAAVAVAGDSAGGGLALAVLSLAAQDQEGALRPCGGAVLSPWTDLALAGESMRTRAEADPILSREILGAMAADYLGTASPDDWRASPLHAPLSGLPQIRIDVGDDEVLLDDARRYTEAARAAGTEVTLAIWKGMPHVFQSSVGTIRAAKTSMDAIGRFLNESLETALNGR